MSDDGKITEIAKAVEGIVKTVPVYQDAVQPAAKQVGQSLETITKAINVALAPVSALVWGQEKIKGFAESKVLEKLKNVPPERIQSPSLLVAGPLLEALRYAGHEETLRELYANLLATSIDSATAENAHPGFVQILQNMSPDEAKIMRLFAVEAAQPLVDLKANVNTGGFVIFFRNFSLIGEKAGCAYTNLTPNYLDNLCRLGLLEIPTGRYIISDGLYEKLESNAELTKIAEAITNSKNSTPGFDKKKIELTDLGKQFCRACVVDKEVQSIV